MKRLYKITLLLGACALAFVSCNDFKVDPRKQVEESAFAKKVGGVDALHTWNIATSKSVTVNNNGPVRVYVSDGRKNVLVSEQNVSGSKTISFDAPAAAKKVTVLKLATGEVRTTEIGGTVSFGAKAALNTIKPGDSVVSASLNTEYVEFPYSQVQTDVNTPAFTDINNSSALFYSESGHFTLRPAWYVNDNGWSANLGIYHYNESAEKENVLIFDNDRLDPMVQIGVSWGAGWQTNYDDFPTIPIQRADDFTGNVRSMGIDVTVPAATAFGFYLHVGSYYGGDFYSEYEYNTFRKREEDVLPDHYIGNEIARYPHFALIEVNGHKYLAADDWCELGRHSLDNPEYYHLVFSVEGDLTDRINDEPVGEDGAWILACEDSGDGADFDFNDVVLSVTHEAGATEADVYVLAAGGTLPVELYYDDNLLGEVHDLFGVQTSTMVNTYSFGKRTAPAHLTVTVPADFNMSATDMGGFSIIRDGSSSVIAAPDMGTVPYMICVPGNWRWPEERVSIDEAYPDFAGWCRDHTQNQTWYLNPVEGKIY